MSPLYRVVPRQDLETELRAQKQASYSSCYDQACQIELGRALAAQKTLATEVTRIGSRCAVNLTVFDLRTELGRSHPVAGGCEEDDIVRMLEAAVASLLGGRASTAIPADAAPPVAEVDPEPPDHPDEVAEPVAPVETPTPDAAPVEADDVDVELTFDPPDVKVTVQGRPAVAVDGRHRFTGKRGEQVMVRASAPTYADTKLQLTPEGDTRRTVRLERTRWAVDLDMLVVIPVNASLVYRLSEYFWIGLSLGVRVQDFEDTTAVVLGQPIVRNTFMFLDGWLGFSVDYGLFVGANVDTGWDPTVGISASARLHITEYVNLGGGTIGIDLAGRPIWIVSVLGGRVSF